MIRDLSVMIAGKAGDGVLFTGNVLARLLKRHGWEVATYRDFPSNIRGEATSYTIRAMVGRVFGLSDRLDILLAFDCQAVLEHLPKVVRNGIVFCDGEGVEAALRPESRRLSFHRLPLRALAREKFGLEIYKNMIALGAMSFVLGLDDSLLQAIVAEIFLERKGESIVRENVKAVRCGYETARELTPRGGRRPLARRPDKGRLLISGDEAIAFGALAAGCRFFAAYPICPASEISQWLALQMPEYGGLVIQTEDELAALNMALGAAYAGARAMTATSGPGASLMMEAFSLAGMAEIPVVIADVQRLGPATGIPTKTQQGDLLQWIFGSHGEFPRVILSPGTVDECFSLTVRAFNLAEKYQLPVVLLTELDMGQNYRTTPVFDLSRVRIDRGKLLGPDALLNTADFKRYEITRDGVSPRALPSFAKGIHLAESLEHDERGYRDETDPVRVRMMKKRMGKLRFIRADLEPPRRWGNRQAEVAFIGFGSTVGVILEVMERLKEKGIPAKFLQLRTLWPFPRQEVQAFLRGTKCVFVVENNFSAQLLTLMDSQAIPCRDMISLRNFSTRNFTPNEILRPVLRAVS